MSDLLTAIYELAKPLIDLIIGALPFVLVGLLLVVIVGRIGLAKLIKLGQRWAGYEEGHRFLAPSTWFKIEPRKHFEVKGKILANEAIRELYAPAAHYTRDLREKERAWKLAWLSPFPAAVKASIKASHTPKGKKLDARRQIADAARLIEVCSLPEGIYVSGDLSKHYQIKLATVGKDPATIEKVENNLLTQLALRGGIQKVKTGDPTKLSFVAHEEPVLDPLEQDLIGADFLDENAAESPMSLPLAMKQDGTAWNFNVHHCLILGTSGSGKGSPLQATIHQEAPFIERGLVQLYGIDPKRSEFKLYADYPTKLFKRISLGMSDDAMREHAETISILKDIVEKRSEDNETSIEEGKVKDGRTFKATREKPLILFLVDEFPTLKEGFEQLGRDGKKPLSELRQIISTGRSLGVYLITATQDGEKTTIDAIKKNISEWILLRQPSLYMNDQVFLYEGAAADGFDSTAIPASTEADGYRSAGVGFVRHAEKGAEKVRFAYISKDDIAALIRRFQTDDDRTAAAEVFEDYTEDDGDFAITDEGEQLPELETFELDDFNDFEEPLPRS